MHSLVSRSFRRNTTKLDAFTRARHFINATCCSFRQIRLWLYLPLSLRALETAFGNSSRHFGVENSSSSRHDSHTTKKQAPPTTSAMSSPAEWPPACTDYNPNYPSQYGYRPNLGLCVAFVIIFGLICIAHGFQMRRYRTLWMIFFVVGSGLECLGWIARAAGHTCSYSRPLFTMQTAVLIMGTCMQISVRKVNNKANVKHRPGVDTSRHLHYPLGHHHPPRSPRLSPTASNISADLRMR